MEQQILTKFSIVKYLLKQNLIDDISGIILTKFMKILIDDDNWKELCPWFAKIRIYGINSNDILKNIIYAEPFDFIKMIIIPKYDLNLFIDTNVGKIYKIVINVKISNHFRKWSYSLGVHDNTKWFVYNDSEALEIIDNFKN